MSDFLLADEVAPLIEKTIGERHAHGMQKDIQEGRAARGSVERLGKTIAILNPDDPRSNHIFCFSSEDLDHLPTLLALYEGQEFQPAFYISSAGFSSELSRALATAGFYQAAFEQTLLYGRPHTKPVPPPESISIAEVKEEEVDNYLEVIAEGFGWHPDWRDAAKDSVRRQLQSPNLYPFIARYEDEPIGTGALTVDGEIGGLSAAAVLPSHRNRGCHIALLHARLYAAHKLGCSIIESGATYGSASFRNQQRIGLRIAYIESEWKKL